MEIHQIIILLRHMRAKTLLGQSIELLIRQYQLWAGVSQPILQDTLPYPWVPNRWLTRIRQTMNDHHITIEFDAWTIPPLRCNDIFLMEAMSELGLTKPQLGRINACRMYLQVTTLAEVTNHTGTSLLPQVLKLPKESAPQGLWTISTSKLNWPNVHLPTPQSWKLWNKTICALFTGNPTGMKLNNQLGAWTSDYHRIREWHWRLSPLGSLLNKEPQAPRPWAAVLINTRRNQLTFSRTIPTNQEFTGPPVTPSDTYQRMVRLLIPPIEVDHPEPNPHLSHKTLTAQFRTTLASWQKPVFGPIHRLHTTRSILQVNQQRGSISLISNASVQKTKQSGFAWILAHAARPLWKGVGLAPGHADDIYSGRAEAFGILAGLTFLHHYLESYGRAHFQPTPIICYCDNLGVITNVNELLMPPSIPRPNDTTNDDRDLYLAISNMACNCHPLRPRFVHVKGHQDKDPHRLLTLPEQYNFDCDRWAKQYTQTATQLSTTFSNPAIPDAKPHLRIRGKIICRRMLKALRHEIDFPEYCAYLKQKHQWTMNEVKDIHWEIFSTALSSHHSEDQQRLILFVNGKLPLRASPAHPHRGSTLCPSCQREQEDEKHFLECMDPAREVQFQALHRDLTQMTQKLQLHPCILTTLWLGMRTIRNHTAYPDILQEVLPPIRSPITHQTRLGWNQLYYGRVSHTWALAIDNTHPHIAPTGTQIMITIQKRIWKYFLDMWAIRNQHLHQNAAQLDLPNY